MRIGQGKKAGLWDFFQIQEIESIIVISAQAEYPILLTKCRYAILAPGEICFTRPWSDLRMWAILSLQVMLSKSGKLLSWCSFWQLEMCFLDLGPWILFETRCDAFTRGRKHITLRRLPLTSRSLLTAQGPIQQSKPGLRHNVYYPSKNLVWAVFGESPVHLCGWQPPACLVLLPSYSWCRREKKSASTLLLRLQESSGAPAAHFSQAAPISEGCRLLGPDQWAALP